MEFNGSGGLAGFNPFGGAPDTYAANNAAYNANQGYAGLAGMYNPFAQSGGFGTMTDYYSGLGAAYGRATGGFGMFPGGGGGGGSSDYERNVNMPIYGGGGIGSDAARAPNQPGNTPQEYYSGGYDPYQASTYAPAAQKNVGAGGQGTATANPWGLSAVPQQQQPIDYSQIPSGIFTGDFKKQSDYERNVNMPIYGGGGIGSDAARVPNQPSPTPQQWYTGGYNPYSPQTYAPAAQQNVGDGYGGGISVDQQIIMMQSQAGRDALARSMQPQYQPIQPGGGFGAPGFGPYGGSTYTGQPGYGLGIGSQSGPVWAPAATGAAPNGTLIPGYGGFSSAPQQQPQFQPTS